MIIIIIPTLLKQDINKCISSISENTYEPMHINLSIGYDNFSKACNSGFDSINSDSVEWVLFLNDDILIKNNFISHMILTANNLSADVVGAKLLYPNNSIQHAGVYFNDKCLPYHIKINEPDVRIYDKILPAVTGACIMVKYDVFNDLGGFDTGYVNCFEDVDFCLRASKKGYRVALCGSTYIIHYEKSTRKFNAEEFKYNKERLLSKWIDYIKYSYIAR